MIVYIRKYSRLCHSERSRKAAKSKNLRIIVVLSSVLVRRSFDSLHSLRMTGAVVNDREIYLQFVSNSV